MSAPRRVAVVSRHDDTGTTTPYEIMRVGKIDKWMQKQSNPNEYTYEVMDREEATTLVVDNLFFYYKTISRGLTSQTELESSPNFKKHVSWLDWLES